MPPFRIAFIGIDHPHGAGWRDSLQQLGDEVEITALVPQFGGATASLEERLAHVPRYTTVDDAVARGSFDGAVVCLPNNTAPDACVKLAQAGKHVLLEKPGAGSAAEAERIVQAVRQAGVAFQSGYMWRYDAGANRLRDMVRDGRFGKLISVETNFVTSDIRRRNPDHYLFDPAVSSGGFFNWLACHFLDLLLYVTGEPIVGVTARVGTFGATPAAVEDGGVAILDLAGGGIATFLGGYWLPRWTGESHWSMRGTERWVHWDPTRKGTGGVIETHGPQPQFYAMNESFSLPEDTTPGYGGARNVESIRDWIHAARNRQHQCRNTPESLLTTLRLIDTIYQASREGRRIECRI
jgi:predicted dehydrogenase